MKSSKPKIETGGDSSTLIDPSKGELLLAEQPQEPPSISFYIQAEDGTWPGPPVLEINRQGFFVEGRKVTDDQQVYEAMVRFLKAHGTWAP